MNAPAVPRYVAVTGFDGCPPGHRFNLYFPIWRETDWQIDKNGKAAALRQSLKLGSAADALVAVLERQKSLAEALPEDCRFVLEGRSTAPFATGLGLEHPVENGFAFLSPYGLPYLAGSGVKGVLRRAAEELESEGGLAAGTVDALFGHEDATDTRRGGLTCWDVFPVPPKGELSVEIMTPHFGHYYQEGGTPHDAGKPNPIPFLAVPAGSAFSFVFTCEPGQADDWKAGLMKVIDHAFDWLGFGAKTAVGYGAMEEDPNARDKREKRLRETEERRQSEQAEVARREALSRMTPTQQAIQQFLDARADKNQPELSALLNGLKKAQWSGDLKVEIADHVKTLMQAAKKWKIKSEKKNPDKDNDYQDTLKVMEWLGEK